MQFEPVHPLRPLKGDDRALEAGQQVKRKGDASDCKDRSNDERIGFKLEERPQQQGCHHVSDNQDRQVGRAVIRAVMAHVFLANGAFVPHLQVA